MKGKRRLGIGDWRLEIEGWSAREIERERQRELRMAIRDLLYAIRHLPNVR